MLTTHAATLDGGDGAMALRPVVLLVHSWGIAEEVVVELGDGVNADTRPVVHTKRQGGS